MNKVKIYSPFPLLSRHIESSVKTILNKTQDALPVALIPQATLPSIKNSATELIKEVSSVEKNRFALSKQVLTFHEYLEEVINNPEKYLRSANQYLVDAIDYWNKVSNIKENQRTTILGHSIKPLVFASKPWESKETASDSGIYGQEIVLNEIYDTLLTSAKKDPERMIILHGPNATGKTRILETLYEALQRYSLSDEGALYTFNWVFKDDDASADSFDSLFPVYSQGKNPIQKFQNEEKGGGVVIPGGLNTNPIYLLNQDFRTKLFKLLEENGKLSPDFNRSNLLSNGLNSSSQKIFDALWKLYSGDINKILSHVQVTRWSLSELNRSGLVVIPPEETQEAQLIPITPEIDWNRLPQKIKEAFRASGLHEVTGAFPQANRGNIFFDDMFKTPDLTRYLPLLRTAEKRKITIASGAGHKSVDEKLDVVIWGTTNDINLYNLQKNYSDWESLKERFNLIPVGYERRYKSTGNIYNGQLKQLIPVSSGRHIAPHILDTFGLWTTMTYLFPPTSERYYEIVDKDPAKPLKKAVMRLDLLNKALLYQGEDVDAYELDPKKQKFNTEEKVVLKRYLKEISNEFNIGIGKQKFLFYEGGTGISPRDGRKLLEDAVKLKPDECLSVLELFDATEEWIKQGLNYEDERVLYTKSIRAATEQASKMRQNISLPPVPEFPPAHKLLLLAKGHTRRKIRFDVQNVLGFIKPLEEHVYSFRKYIEHVKAYRSKQSVPIEWQDSSYQNQPNEKFMVDMEKIFDPIELVGADSEPARSAFRKRVMEAYGQWIGEHPGEDINNNLELIFPELMFKLKAKDIEDNKQKLYRFLYDLKIYYEQKDQLELQGHSPNRKKQIELLHKGLEGLNKLGYCEKCIPKLLDFAFNDDEYKEAMAQLAQQKQF